ncbi:hypothetical protein ATO6_20295 [Oceanicola sp. 22II-s10i]|uniref:flagellar hook-length control protein FliK n=1 Tax=Oceanicola sp. 22II-s10i TaxID=1317116 RepID=UPI000B522323|nr:flagellar hook-length control protein FliK [Oceanicola sp. 22II-s10i]OWU83183.1 hypothetical protein ATO6_20295 [Oceanicola sp. 22II-s10i]
MNIFAMPGQTQATEQGTTQAGSTLPEGARGLFAAILPLMRQAAATGDEAGPDGKVAAIFDKAASALAADDASDAEIETILAEMVNGLAAHLPPELAGKLAPALAATMAPDAGSAPVAPVPGAAVNVFAATPQAVPLAGGSAGPDSPAAQPTVPLVPLATAGPTGAPVLAPASAGPVGSETPPGQTVPATQPPAMAGAAPAESTVGKLLTQAVQTQSQPAPEAVPLVPTSAKLTLTLSTSVPVAPATPIQIVPQPIPARRLAEAVPELRQMILGGTKPGAPVQTGTAPAASKAEPGESATALLTRIVQAAAATTTASSGEKLAPNLLPDVVVGPTPAAGPTIPAPLQVPPLAPPPPAHMPHQTADVRQIMPQIRAQVDDTGQIRVALRPEGLGVVEIDLAKDDSGELRIVVRAENQSVLTALRGDREGLAMMLRDAGHNVGDRNFTFGDLGSGDPRSGTRSDARGEPRGTFTGEAGEADDDAAPRTQRVALDGRVDMSV